MPFIEIMKTHRKKLENAKGVAEQARKITLLFKKFSILVLACCVGKPQQGTDEREGEALQRT